VTEILPTWIEELKSSYQDDDWAMPVLEKHAQGLALDKGISVHGGIIRKYARIYVGKGLHWRTKVIDNLHNSSIGGHSGILGTYHRVRRYFY
jgi:Integrase zinc binding domain